VFGAGAYASNIAESTNCIWLIIYDLNTGHMNTL